MENPTSSKKTNGAGAMLFVFTVTMITIIILARMPRKPQVITMKGTDEDGKQFNAEITIS